MGFFSDITGGSLLSLAGGLLDTGLGFMGSSAEQDIAKSNMKMQREQQMYDREMQQKAWDREDNATQRRVTDLKAAGLSPVLAAGSAASSSSPIKIAAPQMASATGIPKTDFGSKISDMLTIMGQQKALQQADATIAKTKAEEMAIEAQTSRALAQTDMERLNISAFPLKMELLNFERDLAKGNLTKQQAEIRAKELLNDITRYDYDKSRNLGIRYKDTVSPFSLFGSGLNTLGGILDGASAGLDSLWQTHTTGDYTTLNGETRTLDGAGDAARRYLANLLARSFGFRR